MLGFHSDAQWLRHAREGFWPSTPPSTRIGCADEKKMWRSLTGRWLWESARFRRRVF
jgi:hypothetical protein